MTGNLASSSDGNAAISGGPGIIACHNKVLEQTTDRFKSHTMLLGAIKDLLIVVSCLCGIHQEGPNLRRSYAIC